jgi:phosphoribosyl-ATP pyrophosphohydrolase/phosphoribosyl-AMP cyclohydrolase
MTSDWDFLGQLERVIGERRAAPPESSYTAALLAAGPRRIAQKVGEEGVELALAGAGEDRGKVVAESADLLYHMLVLLAARQIPLKEVIAELERRHRPPGS